MVIGCAGVLDRELLDRPGSELSRDGNLRIQNSVVAEGPERLTFQKFRYQSKSAPK